MQKPPIDAPGVIAFPPLLFFAVVAGGMASHFLAPVPLTPRLTLRIVGVIFGSIAGAIALWARAEMVRAGTNVRPDRPSTAVVTLGPYRYTRNPMYLSLCLLNLAVGLLICDLSPVALTLALALILQAGVIVREERYLTGKFGEEYSVIVAGCAAGYKSHD